MIKVILGISEKVDTYSLIAWLVATGYAVGGTTKTVLVNFRHGKPDRSTGDTKAQVSKAEIVTLRYALMLCLNSSFDDDRSRSPSNSRSTCI